MAKSLRIALTPTEQSERRSQKRSMFQPKFTPRDSVDGIEEYLRDRAEQETKLNTLRFD